MVQGESGLDQKPDRLKGITDLAVVVPVYNNAAGLLLLYERLIQVTAGMGITVEYILVDDGSSDDSWNIIARLNSRDHRLKGIRLASNFGQHAATLAGVKASKSRYVVTMDDDLDNPPEAIPSMWSLKDKFDVVYAWPSGQGQEWWKDIGGSLVHALLRWTFNINDRHFPFGSFRLMSEQVVKQLGQVTLASFYFNGEVLKAAARPGYVRYTSEGMRRPTRYTWKKTIVMAGRLVWNYTRWPRIFWGLGILGTVTLAIITVYGTRWAGYIVIPQILTVIGLLSALKRLLQLSTGSAPVYTIKETAGVTSEIDDSGSGEKPAGAD